MNIDEVFNNLNIISQYANKDLGQNYLVNKEYAKKIVDLLNTDKSDNVLEIGAGFGSLSIFLINNEFKTLTLNDVDPRSIDFLDNLVENVKRAYVVNKSALKIDLKTYTKIISNLPYYLTNDLLEYLLSRSNAKKYVLMVQKEVINRINAKVGTEDYGPLAILVNYVGKVKIAFEISNKNFLPSPHISSLVFTLDSNSNNDVDKYQYLQFLKRMFLHRRKTIYNNLSLYLMNKDKAKMILDKIKLSILIRPEQIDPDTYLKIFKLCTK